MISITVIPELFRLADLRAENISLRFDREADRLTLRGTLSDTSDSPDPPVRDPCLFADFIDTRGRLRLSRTAQNYGSFRLMRFCTFIIDVRGISAVANIHEIAEIRLSPVTDTPEPHRKE